MNYVYIGRLVNTHALKGEVRIISDFPYKSRVFNVGNMIYIGKDKTPVIIESYRTHKNYDMVKFKDYLYNDVLLFKGKSVFCLKEDLSLGDEEYLDSDFLGKDAVYMGKNIGKIESIINNNGYKLFVVSGKFIPYNREFIDSVGDAVSFKNLEGIL